MSELDSGITLEGEQIEPTVYITFDYLGNSYNVKRTQDIVHATTTNAERVNLEIVDADGNSHGEIRGELVKDDMGNEEEFRSGVIRNTNIDPNIQESKNSQHVPGLIRESIAQVLLQGKVDRWLSSKHLIEGGEKTYEKLLADSRLTGVKNSLPPFPDGQLRHQYILSKR